MRLLLPVVLLGSLCFAQQATPAEVPVENEPYHHLVFENEYVRVFKVEVAPHEATLVHRHKRDYVVVTIGDAEVTNAVVGKDPKKWSFKDGDVTFLEATGEKSFAHKAVNENDKPFVNYTIELKLGSDLRRPKEGYRDGNCSVIEGELDVSWCRDKQIYIGHGAVITEASEASNGKHGTIVDETLVVVVNATTGYEGKPLFWTDKPSAFPGGVKRAVLLRFSSYIRPLPGS